MIPNPGAFVAPRGWEWPEETTSVDDRPPRFVDKPHVFAVLIGACVYRVAADGAITLVMLTSGLVHYLRTGVKPRGR